MIINNSKYNKKDLCFTIRMWLWKNPLVIIYRFLCTIIGFWFVLCGMNNILSNEQGAELVCLGLVIFYMAFFGLSDIYKMRVKKNSVLDLTRNIKITDDKIEINVVDNEIEINNTYKITSIKKYYIIKDAIVVELKNKKGNIFIHNNGYITGDKEEVVKILNKNNIKEGKSNKILSRVLMTIITLLVIVVTIFIEGIIESKNSKINTGIICIDGIYIELGKPIEYYETMLGVKLVKEYNIYDYRYIITNEGNLDKNLEECLVFYGDAEYIYGVKTYVNDDTYCNRVLFPQGVSIIDNTSLIKEKYSTGLLNFYVRDSIEKKKYLNGIYTTEHITFISDDYRLEIDSVNKKNTSIYYYYYYTGTSEI